MAAIQPVFNLFAPRLAGYCSPSVSHFLNEATVGLFLDLILAVNPTFKTSALTYLSDVKKYLD